MGATDDDAPEGEGVIVGACISVPAGEYSVRYVAYRTAKYFGCRKVVVEFAIVDDEDFAGITLERFYNVVELASPPKKYGNFRPPACG
ncbi:MAG: hypothetical protein AAGA22_01420, partial [Pseudomonadota bacterium]